VVAALITMGIGVALVAPSVTASPDSTVSWSSLGVIRPLLVQPAGWGSTIAAQPRSATYGWCTAAGIAISSGGNEATLVSDRSVGPMLKSAHLALSSTPASSKVVATCENVALDPRHPKTVYAGFQAS